MCILKSGSVELVLWRCEVAEDEGGTRRASKFLPQVVTHVGAFGPSWGFARGGGIVRPTMKSTMRGCAGFGGDAWEKHMVMSSKMVTRRQSTPKCSQMRPMPGKYLDSVNILKRIHGIVGGWWRFCDILRVCLTWCSCVCVCFHM